jgi:hypothetical protein
LHGFRTSFAGWAFEGGYPIPWIDLALAHIIGGQITRAYIRGTLVAERRPMMQRWGDFLPPGSTASLPRQSPGRCIAAKSLSANFRLSPDARRPEFRLPSEQLAKDRPCGHRRAAEPLILNFVELNTVMDFISTVAGLAWRFLSEGYHQANIMREGKAAKKSAVEATLREFVKEEYRPGRKGKEISKAVNLRLVAAGFDEVKDDVVYRRIRKLKFALLREVRPQRGIAAS